MSEDKKDVLLGKMDKKEGKQGRIYICLSCYHLVPEPSLSEVEKKGGELVGSLYYCPNCGSKVFERNERGW